MRWPDLARLWLNATTACTHLPAECPAGSTGSLDRQNRSLWLRRDAGAVQGEARCSACSNSRAIPMDKSGPPPLTMPAVVPVAAYPDKTRTPHERSVDLLRRIRLRDPGLPAGGGAIPRRPADLRLRSAPPQGNRLRPPDRPAARRAPPGDGHRPDRPPAFRLRPHR